MARKKKSTKRTVILCFQERCNAWGSNWKRHLWRMKDLDTDEMLTSEDCFRCGVGREEAAK